MICVVVGDLISASPVVLAASDVEEFSGDGLRVCFIYACSGGFFYF